MRNLLLFCSVIFVSACSPHSQAYQAEDNFSSNLDAAIDRVMAEGDKNCPKSAKVGYLRSSKCMDKYYEQNYSPIFINSSALNHFRHAALVLAAQADRAKMPKDEIKARGDILWDALMDSETASRAQISAQQRVSENAAWAAGLQSLGNNMQQRYQPQPQTQINCYTVNNMVGSTTQCR